MSKAKKQGGGLTIRLYNTLTRKKEAFQPIIPGQPRLYVCGPTVYDRIHIGNARPLVVFDVLYRLLKHCYGKVTYVRNITDIDDKIMARAAETGVDVADLTDKQTKQFHADCKALGVLPPDHEPRATGYIDKMVALITRLLAKGHAYQAEGHVLFEVASFADYGKLSRRSVAEMKAGARVEVAPYKKAPSDFVLWKPSTPDQPGWKSPWGRGRPGWHIECSAMSHALLGATFDIHGGGCDLTFPHHENEIAQSRAAFDTPEMARVWMHNGYVNMLGEKMAKSVGNVYSVEDALTLAGWSYGSAPSETLRYALLATQYRQPLEFSPSKIQEEESALSRLYRAVGDTPLDESVAPDAEFMAVLADDLNTPKAFVRLHELAKQAGSDKTARQLLKRSAYLFGLLTQTESEWRKGVLADARIQGLIEKRNEARNKGNYHDADTYRDLLADMGIILEDTADGTTWRRTTLKEMPRI